MYLRPAFGRVSISNIAYLLHHRKDGKYMAENPNNLQAAENAEPTAEELSEVLRVRREKFAALKEAGRNPFEQTRYDRTAYTQQIAEHFDELDEQMVSIAGRIMSKRSMGKASFFDVADASGRIQIYIKRDIVGEETYDQFKKWDIGDIVGVKGEVFRTKHGEISIRATEAILLSKSLLPLPEKFHGLTNTDLRYRQRYVDLIMNPEVRDVFVKRSLIIRELRNFLDNKGYLEVETPVLHNIAGGAAARPFITHHNSLNIDMYLRIALELHLKRLIVGGFDKVYEIGRVFRNEGMDTKHNPEFTMLEFYQAYSNYEDIMNLTEEMLRYVAQKVLGTTTVVYGNEEIDLGKPFARITMVEAVKKYTGVDFDEIHTLEEARAVAKEHKVQYEERHLKGDILNLFFDEFVEDKLVQPTFLMGHPVEISPLSKRMADKPDYTERFELFITGREFANAFSELNDPIDQKERFEHQLELKAQGDEEATDMDNDFINALEYGLPPTGGFGMGVDRLVMFLTNQPSIRDVLLFPTMKPTAEEQSKKAATPVACAVKEEATEVAVSAESVQLDLSKVKVEPLFEDMIDFDTFSKSDFRVVKVEACEAVPKSKKLLKFTLNDGSEKKRTILSGIHEYYEPEELVGKTCVAITNLPPRKMMGIDSEGMLISAVYEYDGHEGLNLLMLDDTIPAGAKLY